MNKNLVVIDDIIFTFINEIKKLKNKTISNVMFNSILDKIDFITVNSSKEKLYKTFIIDMINSFPQEKSTYKYKNLVIDDMIKQLKNKKRINKNTTPFNKNKNTAKIAQIWNGILSLKRELENNS